MCRKSAPIAVSPPLIDRFDVSFLDRPRASLSGDRPDAYVEVLRGGLIVLACGLLAPLLARRRAVLAAAGGAALAFLAWLNAPFTGASDDPVLDFAIITTRYLFPALCAALAALALATTGGAAARRIAHGVLGLAALWSFYGLARGVHATPDVSVPLAGAVAGAIAGALLVARALRLARPAVALSALALLAAAALAVATDGFVARHVYAGGGDLPSAGAIGFVEAHPSFRSGEDPVAFAPQVLGVLAGDRLDHRIELIAPDEPCAAVRRRAATGWVVIGDFPFSDRSARFTAPECLAGVEPAYRDEVFSVYYRVTAAG